MVATFVTLLLKLASNITLQSYDGYVGGSRYIYAIIVCYAIWVMVMHGKKQVWFDILANNPVGATNALGR